MNGLYQVNDEQPKEFFTPSPGPLKIEYNERAGTVRIEGVTFAVDFFRAMAHGLFKGDIFEFCGRDTDGAITLRKVIIEKPIYGVSGVMVG